MRGRKCMHASISVITDLFKFWQSPAYSMLCEQNKTTSLLYLTYCSVLSLWSSLLTPAHLSLMFSMFVFCFVFQPSPMTLESSIDLHLFDLWAMGFDFSCGTARNLLWMSMVSHYWILFLKKDRNVYLLLTRERVFCLYLSWCVDGRKG